MYQMTLQHNYNRCEVFIRQMMLHPYAMQMEARALDLLGLPVRYSFIIATGCILYFAL